MGFLRKLKRRNAWKRLFYERLTEPLHLNFLSVFVGLFGSYRLKIEYDLIIRPYNAFGILRAAELAKAANLSSVSVIEFGVASGAGLMNMCLIAQKISSLTGVDIKVFGFDTGKGMPAPLDYRDHPDLYLEGDFTGDFSALQRILPSNGQLVIGDLAGTVPQFIKQHASEKSPIGYVMLDVDYYSSTVEALKLFEATPRFYLPCTALYLDDIHFESHNPFAGELLAVNEFNERNRFRKICRNDFLECSRIFKHAEWLKHMYVLQVMDHPTRQTASKRTKTVLVNPYL